MPTGSVKWYDKDKGFGFAASEDGQEYYLPSSALPAGVGDLRKGTRIEFGVAEGRRGAQAMGVRLLDKLPSVSKAKRTSPKELAPWSRTSPPSWTTCPGRSPRVSTRMAKRAPPSRPPCARSQINWKPET